MLALDALGDQGGAVVEPERDIGHQTAVDRGAGVAPHVAKHIPIARHQHVVAGGVGDAGQSGRAH